MAAEVIALLHNLLTAPVTSTAQTWAEAVQRVLCNALSGLPVLLASTEALASPRTHALQLMSTAKLANAALAALGAFHETVKPGCAVKVSLPSACPSWIPAVMELSFFVCANTAFVVFLWEFFLFNGCTVGYVPMDYRSML